ncbi:MFS transporter [Fodinicola acaciae]|uniref:MFS transporter n=1 Tax=Fodinicola acaciae TaxID=2681555 RepID=UPI0013D64F68|nr:MFS transporter [Fodinicola acaciae]
MKTSVDQRRSFAALFTGAVLVSAAMTAGSVAATLVFADLVGPAWGGVPNAAAVAGTAVGALLLTGLATRRGRRFGLISGYATGAVGGLTALASVVANLPVALLLGMFLLGIGNGGMQLSRYAAAEWFSGGRKGFVMGAIVWAGTIGAVGAPLLLEPMGKVAMSVGGRMLDGAYALAAVAMVASVLAAAVVARRPPPAERIAFFGSGEPIRALLRRPDIRVAAGSMVVAQLVMVAIMTAAPVDMHEHGHGLAAVGMVLSLHTLGMFALAPISGWLTDRFGGRRVIAGSVVTLAASALFVLSSSAYGWPGLPIALFLLGYGWNLAVVGGSGLLVRELPEAAQTRAQGLVEATSWGAATVATIASTAALSAGGYLLLAPLAGVFVVIPVVLLVSAGRKVVQLTESER